MDFPVFIRFFSFSIHPHPLFETLSFFIGFRLYLHTRRPNHISETTAVWVLVGAILGSLFFSVALASIENPALFWKHFIEGKYHLLIQGKTIVGGLLGGLIGVEITKKIIGHTSSTGDDMVIPLASGILIGRIGCFLTGLEDRTYGIPTNAWTAIDFGDGIPRHPTQLYEILFLLVVIIFSWAWRNKKLWEGFLFQCFMFSYLLFRWTIEWIKPTQKPFLEMSNIQIACFFGISYYVWLFIYNYKQYKHGRV